MMFLQIKFGLDILKTGVHVRESLNLPSANRQKDAEPLKIGRQKRASN
jgi:hypothetical protein